MNENWMKDYNDQLSKICSEYPAMLDMYSLKECEPKILNSLVNKYFAEAQVIHVAGMQRVGNHIINHWLLSNSGVSTAYFNNATLYPAVSDSVRIFNCDHTYPKELERVICTYENLSASKLRGLDFYYIIRDPYNWLASLMKYSRFNERNLESFIETYIQNAETCQKFIVYNQWVSNSDYRNKLASDLGFVNKDLGVNHVPEYGTGSTFDGREYEGRGSQMSVLERWKILSEDPAYLAVIKKYRASFESISLDICGFPSPF